MTTLFDQTIVLAATYDCNAYGEGAFGDGSDCIASTETGSSSNPLADTGSPYFIGLVSGIILIVLGIVIAVAVALKRRKQPANK